MISKANIQLVKGLQDKKQRQKYGQFVVEGEKSIAELLTSAYTTIKLFALPEWISQNRLSAKGIPCVEVNEKELRQLSVHQAPQKVLALAEIPQVAVPETGAPFILGLDEIQDPGNLGTIIRIADWYGIRQIVCSKGSTDVYAPKCINASMGSFLRVKVLYADLLDFSVHYNYPLIVSALDGENIHKGKLPDKGMLVIGNEGHGVSSRIQAAAAYRFSIPRFGKAESLNAAVSTAVMLDNLIR